MKPCLNGGEPWDGPGASCPEHGGTAGWASSRGSSTQRGYGADHRAIAKVVLREEPICQCGGCGKCSPRLSGPLREGARSCHRRSTVADHIRNRARGGKNERSNYQALCSPCHSVKTAREGGKKSA